MSDLPEVVIHVDGAAIPNPGNAGAGVVLIYGEHRREISEPLGHGLTNNAAEILAAVTGLKALKRPSKVTLWSDSQYLIETMNGKFRRGTNLALWYVLDQAAQPHVIVWKWQRGHIGIANNERAHDLAEQAARSMETQPLFGERP